jgi:hypothetical protein
MSRRPTMTRKPAKTRHSSTTKRRRTSKRSSLARPAVAQPTSPMPTGNGFGYAVVNATSGALIRFFAHPYRFMRPPADVKKNGPRTTNFIGKNGKAVWGSRSSVQSVSYLKQSHIIEIIGGKSKAYFFMPFTLERNVLLAASDAVDPCLAVKWRKGRVRSHPQVVGSLRVEVVKFKNVRERIVVVPLAGMKSARAAKFYGPAFGFMSVENDDQIQAAVTDFQNWRRGQSVKGLIDRELRALEKWRVTPAVKFSSREARDLWRQSETVLRMGQIRERDHRAFGLINASLPAGEFFIPFVRDMSYAVVALTKMGHREEAKAGLDAYYNAGPIGNLQAQVRRVPYQISLTRYFGDGSEETDFSGAKYRNLEFDNWGLALWATGEYFAKYRDKAWLNTRAAHGTIYETARDYVIEPLVANLDPIGKGGLIFARDSSCWEQNGTRRKHYAFSNITAIGGLKAFVPIADAVGDRRTVAKIQKIIRQMRTGFQSAFVKGGEVRGTMEAYPRNAMDGALLEGINFAVITKRNQIESTLSRMCLLKTGSGGYRRVLGITDEYEAHEFLLINFNLARAYIRRRNPATGDALVERMQHKAADDNNLIPEMYVSRPNEEFDGPIGAPTGSIPMVGYGAGAYILYLMERRP